MHADAVVISQVTHQKSWSSSASSVLL